MLHQDFGSPASLAGLWLSLQRASLRILSPERPRGPLGSRGSGRSGVQQRLPPGACRSALSSGAWCAVGTQARCQTNEPSLRGRLPEVLPSKPRRVSTGKPGSAPGCPLARLAPNSPQSQGRCGPATAPGLASPAEWGWLVTPPSSIRCERQGGRRQAAEAEPEPRPGVPASAPRQHRRHPPEHAGQERGRRPHPRSGCRRPSGTGSGLGPK